MSSHPVWQPDLEVKECPLCATTFNLWYRRHHCRHCGRVVCGACSAHRTTYLATSYVVSPPGLAYIESPLVPHKTCTECVRELELIRNVDSGESLVQSVPAVQEDLSRCPICEILLVHMRSEEMEEHVDRCLTSYSRSPPSTWRNRMIVYKLSAKEEMPPLGECDICFEEFEPGQSVGRLECLCVFHDECILKWFHKKGAGKCPVHNVGNAVQTRQTRQA